MNAEVQERVARMRRMLDDRQAEDLEDDECWLGLQIQLSAIESTARRSLATEVAKRRLEVAIDALTCRRTGSDGADEARRYARTIEALEGYEHAIRRSTSSDKQDERPPAA